jgi:hypothetical protein
MAQTILNMTEERLQRLPPEARQKILIAVCTAPGGRGIVWVWAYADDGVGAHAAATTAGHAQVSPRGGVCWGGPACTIRTMDGREGCCCSRHARPSQGRPLGARVCPERFSRAVCLIGLQWWGISRGLCGVAVACMGPRVLHIVLHVRLHIRPCRIHLTPALTRTRSAFTMPCLCEGRTAAADVVLLGVGSSTGSSRRHWCACCGTDRAMQTAAAVARWTELVTRCAAVTTPSCTLAVAWARDAAPAAIRSWAAWPAAAAPSRTAAVTAAALASTCGP